MNHITKIATQLKIKPGNVEAAVSLLDEGNTIPFVARYRKERTGALDEDQLRNIASLVEKLRALDDRRSTIIKTIEEQEKMTPELLQKINKAESLTILEDLYLPYKPKRRTRASIAKENGLQELADFIIQQGENVAAPEKIAEKFLSENVTTIEDALTGGRDIVAETISDNSEIRQLVREKAFEWGVIECTKNPKAEDPKLVFETYYEFECRVNRLRPHQILALNRGENEKVLKVKLTIPERDWKNAITQYFKENKNSPFHEQLLIAMEESAERLLLPAIERDIRRQLSETAETHAINVFSTNLKELLSQPPLAGFAIMGIDPGYRTGCKVAVIDNTGKVLDTATIYPHPPQKKATESLQTLQKMIEDHNVKLISIGNGTASRETEALTVELIKNSDDIKYLIANEAGASVYSASPLARAELPDMDVSMRGAVSIARRVQDPLAELVKIDPKSIGVGMYQHDVNQKQLSSSLEGVVENVVNRVGVEINTASPALLTHVSGIGPTLAKKIVDHRDTNGKFQDRSEITKIPGLGPKAYEQSVGFFRINDGTNPLDASAIHPESYPIAEEIIHRSGIKLDSTIEMRKKTLDTYKKGHPVEALAKELDCGIHTLNDIFDQLIQPGRDPRKDLPLPILRSDVLSIDDLVVGMQLKGTVRNVTDFGSFVDIGVKQDGLMHRTQIPANTKPRVGQIIKVEILKIEPERGRISLKWAAQSSSG